MSTLSSIPEPVMTCQVCGGEAGVYLQWIDENGNMCDETHNCWVCENEKVLTLFQVNCLNPVWKEVA